ncbi:alpha-2,8-polysialyltransferase family protein [Brevibacterium sp. 50QC2O2]|uniref:alpha-2,8-polysialyltransferase family protein n=1 Tax=Brevibacterium sp. 50QC2O2 TaxID=2968459 RepID=UPI00211C8C3A|nr:alpha-2,8-polysialyltransferase family protein [Brevibacterium sp. 50QC2O2]MCQ9387833.1 alpha-2,8-polysialyltransferase family protein [Brevibacterium sp. 50QC2O2]
MKQIFEVSSLFQLANLHAALSAGLIGPADERILLISDNRVINDFGAPFHSSPIGQTLTPVFDRVIEFNRLIWPNHPATWRPRADDLPLLERLLRREWNLGTADLELYVESIQSPPATALAEVFGTSAVFVHADGLMSYGPTRNVLPVQLSQRLAGLIIAELVPGLDPVLLAEYRVPVLRVPAAALRATFELMSRAADPALAAFAADTTAHTEHTGPTAIIVGQYLADIDLLTTEEEQGLYASMLRTAVDEATTVGSGAARILFKPHPAAGAMVTALLHEQATALGVQLEVLPAQVPVELCIHRLCPDLIVGCFSTALATASGLYGVRAYAVGTELALERFTPYENSNRIPVTICDFLWAQGGPGGEPSPTSDLAAVAEAPAGRARAAEQVPGLQRLVHAVAYCMQPQILPGLREEAASLLADAYPAHARYFKRRRLTKLDLPGRLPPKPQPEASGSSVLIRKLRRRAGRFSGRIVRRVRRLRRTRGVQS